MITFCKYQGTGNDFVMIDNRAGQYYPTTEKNRLLCDRRFGIGADGLICLQPSEQYDFEMLYFNSDGNESTMCGNGGRCLVAFAQRLGIINGQATFDAIDGLHQAINSADGWVELQMTDVEKVEQKGADFIINTGSPHYVRFVERVADVDVFEAGRRVRYNETYKKEGINVNFVEVISSNGIKVATYERGVEGETLSCGTGVTAAAMAIAARNQQKRRIEIPIQTKGGELAVKFTPTSKGFKDVWLCGPATYVFEGRF